MPEERTDDATLKRERFSALETTPMTVTTSRSPFFGGTLGSIREILAQRELLMLLVRRDLKARYKDSALGFIWSLVRPLTQLLIYYIVMGQFLGAARGIPSFAIYVFTGLTAYTFLSEMISSGTGSIVGNTGLIKKIYLPREIFPLASVGSAGFNFMIQLVVLFGATLALRQFPWSPNIIYFLPAVAVLVLYGAAFAILLSALNVYMRDIQYLVEVILLVILWGSPVVYSWKMVSGVLAKHPAILEVYSSNPLTLAVLGFQRSLWMAGAQAGAQYPSHLMLRLCIAAIVGVVLLLVFQRIFARMQGNFAQEL
jgi:ABC-2 type transport system permease protein